MNSPKNEPKMMKMKKMRYESASCFYPKFQRKIIFRKAAWSARWICSIYAREKFEDIFTRKVKGYHGATWQTKLFQEYSIKLNPCFLKQD